MAQRDHDRGMQPSQGRLRTASRRGGDGPVLALQRSLGNRATAQLLARKGAAREQGDV